MVRLTIEEAREQEAWALRTLRLGQSGDRAGLHAELLRQENAVIDLLPPHMQEIARRNQ